MLTFLQLSDLLFVLLMPNPVRNQRARKPPLVNFLVHRGAKKVESAFGIIAQICKEKMFSIA